MDIALFLRKSLRPLPLLGGLADARWHDHREAFKEVAINIVFSTSPIWLGCVFLFAARGFTSLGELVHKNIEHGEMFIYATASIAPLYYFIFKEYEGVDKFPNASGFMFLGAIVLLLGGCGFAVTRLLAVIGVASSWNEDLLFTFSWMLYIAAVAIVYLAHVYRNWSETGAAAAFTTQTQDMVNTFNQEPRS